MENRWDLNDILLKEIMELKNYLQLKFEETIQSQKIYANNGEIQKENFFFQKKMNKKSNSCFFNIISI